MKEFEERFSELQVDMISICMEYVENRADKVYVCLVQNKSTELSRNFVLKKLA